MSFWMHKSRLSLMWLALSPTIKILAIVSSCLVTLVGLCIGWYVPLCRDIAQKQSALVALHQKHHQLKKDSMDHDREQVRHAEFTKNYSQLASLHAGNNNLDMLLEVMHNNHIVCHGVQPTAIKHQDGFDVHHVLIQSRGSFQSFLALFDDLEKSKQIFSFKYVALSKGKRADHLRCEALVRFMSVNDAGINEVNIH